MSLLDFKADPWKNSHPAYDDGAFFTVKPAPETATAEVVVSSLYRASGFESVSETNVPANGREFSKDTSKPNYHKNTGSKIDLETWRILLQGILESPKQPNQSSKRFLQMSPVIPEIAIYSGSARLAGNSWNPGLLIQRMIGLGADNYDAAAALWRRLFDALSVTENDDVWARWLKQEFDLRQGSHAGWDFESLGREYQDLPPEEKMNLSFPAKQFVRDLDAILDTKSHMTRKQWISLLEALLRLASVSHVIWLCDVHDKIWRNIEAILWRNAEPTPAENVSRDIVNCQGSFLTYGNAAVKNLEDYASRYLVARIGINCVLWHLGELGIEIGSLGSCVNLSDLFYRISENKYALNKCLLQKTFEDLLEEHVRTISCKKGIGSNLKEFALYVLGQRKTANDTLRGYDQGYILRKQAEYDRAPWIVSMGPVTVLALVHCCLKDAAGPRSITRLSQHLACYGIDVDRDDITLSDLGRKLRMLGLVLDSPDAESGMLLMPPFETNRGSEAND